MVDKALFALLFERRKPRLVFRDLRGGEAFLHPGHGGRGTLGRGEVRRLAVEEVEDYLAAHRIGQRGQPLPVEAFFMEFSALSP